MAELGKNLSEYTSMADEFSKVFKQVSKVIEKASIATLNKAAAVAKTQFSSDIRTATGLNAKQVNTRLFVLRASKASPKAVVAIGTKYGVDATYFKPVQGYVNVVRKGAKKAQSYQTVTVSVPGTGSTLLDGAFIGKATTSGSLRVFKRVGADRLPLAKLYLFAVRDAAIAARPAAQQRMLSYYGATLDKTIAYFLSKQDNVTLEDGDDGPA